MQSINIFNVLGGNRDPTEKKFSSVNSCSGIQQHKHVLSAVLCCAVRVAFTPCSYTEAALLCMPNGMPLLYTDLHACPAASWSDQHVSS